MQMVIDKARKEKLTAELNNIVFQLIHNYQPEKIILFGSMLTGDVREYSDIDLMIIKRNVPVRRIDRTLELETRIKRKYATDYLVYTPEEINIKIEKGDIFIKNIMEYGKVLYES
jgi:predicted nucleotidyltransferase